MSLLLDLPNGILQHIASDVDPSTIESLSMCSKAIYNMAQRALRKHLEMKKKYSTIGFGGMWLYSNVIGVKDVPELDLASFVYKISRDRDIALYPTKLYIGALAFKESPFSPDEEYDDETKLKDYLFLSETLVHACPFTNDFERDV